MVRRTIEWQLTKLRRVARGKTPQGLQRAVGTLAQEIILCARHRRAVRRARRMRLPPEPKLHLGCGRNLRPGWINIDVFVPTADLTLDLREPLPFPDASIATIYSEHFIEHIEEEDAVRLVAECVRVLRPGGLLSVGFPDAEEELQAYASNDREFFDYVRWRIPSLRDATKCQIVNYDFRQRGEHRFIYDLETMTRILERAGFREIGPRAFDPARDSEEREFETVYVDAVKPSPSQA
jgi:predicted SAM-dependent methyltransferase